MLRCFLLVLLTTGAVLSATPPNILVILADDRRWGKGGDASQPVQLYHLANDLGETKNLAAARPEKVAEMQALLEKLITEGRNTPGARQRNDVKVVRHPRPAATKKPKQG